MDLIRLSRAEIGYSTPLLQPLELAVAPGQRLAVLGPNGGGKSTLLKSLIGLVPLLSGERTHPNGRAPRIGYVPQAHRADPVFPLTALQVVVQGRYGLIGVGRFAGRADTQAALAQLERVGLGAQARKSFRSLSGGQRQRVLLARALCSEPELLVLDEFTSDLDPAASSALLAEVSALTRDGNVAVIFVTHEPAAAAAHSTHLALVDSRRKVFDSGPTEELLTSERLTRLYGQQVYVEHRNGRTLVFVDSQGAAP